MSSTFALGNYLVFTAGSTTQFFYQNFFIGNDQVAFRGNQFKFLPFGFSGVTVNRNGDNTDATLVLPNNELSRPWAIQAMNQRWLAKVFVMSLNPDNTTQGTILHTYTGQVAEGSWDETSLNMRLNTVLDAVGSDVPLRRLTQKLIGSIPMTSNVRLQ